MAPRLRWLAGAALLLAVLSAPQAALAQDTITLVSTKHEEGFVNLQKAAESQCTQSPRVALNFTTGSNPMGYYLDEFVIHLPHVAHVRNTSRAYLYTGTSSSRGDNQIATLNGVPRKGLNTFTSSSGISLDPNTRYVVRLHFDVRSVSGEEASHASAYLSETRIGHVPGRLPGWSIGDGWRRWNTGRGGGQGEGCINYEGTWDRRNGQVMFEVRGRVRGTNAAPEFPRERYTHDFEPWEGYAVGVNGRAQAHDADGDRLVYTLSGTDAASFTIDRYTGQISTNADVAYDHNTKHRFDVTVTVDDQRGGTDTAEVRLNLRRNSGIDLHVEAPPDTSGELLAEWHHPGTKTVSRYLLRYSTDPDELFGTFVQLGGSSWGGNLSHRLTGLTPGTEYTVRVEGRYTDGSWAAFSVDRARTGAGTDAPPEPLTAAFGELPRGHGGAAFTFDLTFSEEVDVDAETLRDHAFTVTGGSVTAVEQADAASTRSWRVTVTPSSAADAVTIALAPKASCEDEGAICTADSRALSAAVEAEVPGREPTHVVSAALTSGPGANGTWDTGEMVTAEVVFNREVAVYGPPGVTPTLGITLDKRRREAVLTSTGSTATFTFSHTVTAADDGATVAALVANGITLNGTVIGDNQGNAALLDFSVATGPALSVADVSVTEGPGATADFVVTLAPAASETVTVDYATADGTATAPADYTSTSGTLTFAAGETSKTVSVPVIDDTDEDSGETFTLTLANPSGGGAYFADATATATIHNDETAVRPRVTAVELLADASGDGRWDPGEAIEVHVTFSEPVTVTGGLPWIEVSFGGPGGMVPYVSGSDSATLVFSFDIPSYSNGLTDPAVVPDSLTANGAEIVSAASELVAELGHEGAEPGATPGTPATALTAELLEVPAGHGGRVFTVDLRFSEDVTGLSYLTLRDHAFTVAGGTVTGARRLDRDGAEPDREWEIAIAPAANAGDVTVTLPATTDCAATGAVCVDDRPLSAAVSVTVPREAAVQQDPATPFTVRLDRVPAEHDGTTAIVFRVLFNKKPDSAYSYVTMRDATVRARRDGAAVAVSAVERLNKPHNDRWQITVPPGGKGDVTVSVGPFSSCSDTGAVCIGDGTVLSNAVSATILGPPGLSVADARVHEAANAALDFAVTMSRASSATVTVDYATSDGTATAGSDYTATSGTLTFAAGDTAKTVSVPVLDDGIDEGEETFTLTLSNASGGNAWLKDAEATGTIENSDAMPQAWLARFGRTIASQAVDAIGGRMEGGGSSHVTVGGQSLPLSGGTMAPDDGEDLESPLMRFVETGDEPGETSRGVTGREVLLGSSFHLAAGGEDGGTAFAAWGRFTTGGFEADVDDVRLDGSVTSGFLGADVGAADWLVGVAVSASEGEGSYTLLDTESDDSGEVESSLTAFYPYARLSVSETTDVWGLVGYGTGELTLMQNPGTDRAQTYETDIGMRMGAVGARGEVISPEEPDRLTVALKSDAFWVRTSSDAVNGPGGNLAASEADVTRVRVLVEGSRSFETGSGRLTPSLELGLRNDGGDAETGTGIEAGAGLRYSGGGVTVEGSVRTLVTHEEAGYEEWGASGSVRIDPGPSGEGLSLSVVPAWGAASGGAERLWSLADAGRLGSDGGFEAGRRLETEVGYGLGLGRTPGVLTPYVGLSLGDGSGRAWRTGARWSVEPSLTLGLEATRSEAAGGGAADRALALRGSLRW